MTGEEEVSSLRPDLALTTDVSSFCILEFALSLNS